MYYSDVSALVRWCGSTLKVRGPATLFLPVLSGLHVQAALPNLHRQGSVNFPRFTRNGTEIALSVPAGPH